MTIVRNPSETAPILDFRLTPVRVETGQAGCAARWRTALPARAGDTRIPKADLDVWRGAAPGPAAHVQEAGFRFRGTPQLAQEELVRHGAAAPACRFPTDAVGL